MSRLKIIKGGRLMLEEWDHEAMTSSIKDVTDSPLFFMDSECDIEEGLRLWDIFRLVEDFNLYPVLSPILTHSPHWLEQIVREGLYPTKSDMSGVVLRWEGSVTNYDDAPEISIWPHFFGIKNDIDDRWGLSFSPANEFTDCEIRIDKKLTIYDDRNGMCSPPVLVEVEKQFTLQELLHGIFYDLSFHGGTYERNQALAEIMGQSERIRNGLEDTKPFDSVEELMEDLNREDE